MADPNGEVPQKLDEMLRLFRERIERDDVQQRAFDTLYAELAQYKDDFLFQAEKPLLLDLLLFYDSLHWFRQSLTREEMSPEVVVDSFQFLMDEFLELLYRRDVVPADQADRFDARLHKAVRVVPATSAADDWRIQAVLKRGFVRGARTLRAEEVSVFRVGVAAPESKD